MLPCFEEGEAAEGDGKNSKQLVFRKIFEFTC